MNMRTIIGDVFCVKIDGNCKKYLQYIISDLTQLNSDVVRVFKKSYPINEEPDLTEVVKGNIDFYFHFSTRIGMKRGLWERVGNVKDVGETRHILFKTKGDYTNKDIQDDWAIWRINEDPIHVDVHSIELKQAYLGVIFQPERIVYRLKTGTNYGVYAKYD